MHFLWRDGAGRVAWKKGCAVGLSCRLHLNTGVARALRTAARTFLLHIQGKTANLISQTDSLDFAHSCSTCKCCLVLLPWQWVSAQMCYPSHRLHSAGMIDGWIACSFVHRSKFMHKHQGSAWKILSFSESVFTKISTVSLSFESQEVLLTAPVGL